MQEWELFEENKSSQITSDVIIEKFIPIIGAILLVSWLWYLLYTSVWVILPEIIRIIIWFITSIGIIVWWVKLWEKLRYFWDVIIGIWVLLLYGTLIYWSRTNGMENATIPEIASLSVSFIFTFVISYFAQKRNSKVILILGLIWAYLTPFVIWWIDSWKQSISFNSYLIYFTTVNVVLFQMSKDFALKNIAPLNILWLFFWTSTLYKLSYAEWISNVNSSFFSSDLFSWILFLILAIFSIWSLLITHKNEENKAEWYLAIWYMWTVLWFILNMSMLSIPEISKWIFYILLSVSCFIWWHTLEEWKTRFEHIALYASGILNWVLAFSIFIPELNSYTSILIWYIGLIFWGLYSKDPSKKERLLSYYLFTLVGALYSVTPMIWNDVDFKTFYIILSLIPMLFAYFITKNNNHEGTEIAKIYSLFWLLIIWITLLVEVINFINFWFFIFYIIPLLWVLYIYFNKNLDIISKTNTLRVLLIWFVVWYISTFFQMLWQLSPAPINTHIFSWNGFLSHWMFINWLFGSIILFISLKLSHYLDENDTEYHPVYLISILYYASIFVFWSQLIFAFINDLWVSSETGWIRAVCATLYWILLAIWLIFTGIKNGIEYRSEKILWIILIFITIIKIIFYDMAEMETNNKVIVLMIVWWLLLLFSYFIHKNWWLKSQPIESKKPKKNIEIITQVVEEKKYNINESIKNIDISNIESIKFDLNNKKSFNIKSKNLFKIVISITNNLWKTSFKAHELEYIYANVINNYKSELNQNDYNKLIWIIKEFIDVWGSVYINKKENNSLT